MCQINTDILCNIYTTPLFRQLQKYENVYQCQERKYFRVVDGMVWVGDKFDTQLHPHLYSHPHPNPISLYVTISRLHMKDI
jgi:hypothetical protein